MTGAAELLVDQIRAATTPDDALREARRILAAVRVAAVRHLGETLELLERSAAPHPDKEIDN